MPIAKVGDISIEYYVEGSGPPLVMIMGFSGQASSWSERFLELLRPHFQIVRFSKTRHWRVANDRLTALG